MGQLARPHAIRVFVGEASLGAGSFSDDIHYFFTSSCSSLYSQARTPRQKTLAPHSPPLRECRGLRFVDDQVVDFTQPLNLDPTSLPRLHVARRHLCPADPRRRARRQYVAGLERKGGGQKCDHLRNLVDEFRGVAVLARLFVDPCADAKHVGVRDLVRSSQPWTYGAMGIE